MTTEERNRALVAKQRKRDEEIVAALAAFSLAIGEARSTIEDRAEHWIRLGINALSLNHFLNFVQTQADAAVATPAYLAATRDLVAHQGDAVDDIPEQAELLGVTPNHVSSDVVTTLQAITLARFTRTSTNLSAFIAENITLGHLMDDSHDAITATVSHSLDQLESTSAFIAESALYTADRAISYQAFHDVVKEYLFFGPADDRNRPFCAVHVGKTFTREEISRMRNDSPPPFANVWVSGGGPNCRHNWLVQAL